jgi:hypothetical protein
MVRFRTFTTFDRPDTTVNAFLNDAEFWTARCNEAFAWKFRCGTLRL